MTGHVHAKLMALYAQDAAETDTPWERWELNSGEGWRSLSSSPIWHSKVRYRRKPKPSRERFNQWADEVCKYNFGPGTRGLMFIVWQEAERQAKEIVSC